MFYPIWILGDLKGSSRGPGWPKMVQGVQNGQMTKMIKNGTGGQ